MRSGRAADALQMQRMHRPEVPAVAAGIAVAVADEGPQDAMAAVASSSCRHYLQLSAFAMATRAAVAAAAAVQLLRLVLPLLPLLPLLLHLASC